MTSTEDKNKATAQEVEPSPTDNSHRDTGLSGFSDSNSNSDLNSESEEEEDDEEEEEELGRSSMIRPRQARNADDSSDSDDSDGSGYDEDDLNNQGNESNDIDIEDNDEDEDEDFFVGDMNTSDRDTPGETTGKKSKNKALSEKEILRAQKKEKKSGVVYMSRVPPFMKPAKVRHLLEKYAEIGRIYLVEEDDKRRKRRLKSGGNRRKQFVEGWIEFKNKKYAKSVASMLNSTAMGGKKHGFYHDDLWNLKYLPKFKWRHLTEQLASEKAAREQRLQSEISQSRKELEEYMKNVEKAKMLSGMKAKKEAQAKKGLDVAPMRDRSRNVWQRDVIIHSTGHAADALHKGKSKNSSSNNRGDNDDDQGDNSRGNGRGSDNKRRKTMANVLDQIF